MTSFFAVLRKALGRAGESARSPTAGEAGGAALHAAPSIKLRAAAYSDAGPVRDANEDRVRYVLEDAGALGERVSLVVIADGMGGHQAGEIAAEIAIEVITDVWRHRYDHGKDAGAVLRKAIERAGAAIHSAARSRRDWNGMGTTVAALAFTGDSAVVGHVGDSRVYLFRDGGLVQLTEDDTLVNHLIRTGAIAPWQGHDHPDRGVLSQALGTRPAPLAVHIEAPLVIRDGDLFLLCSDGLHDVLSDARLTRHLATYFDATCDLAALARTLAESAFAAGTQDNVSIALVAAGGRVDAAVRDRVRPTRPLDVIADPQP